MSIDIRDIQAPNQSVPQRTPAAPGATSEGASHDGRAAPAGAQGAGERVRLSPEAQRLNALSESARSAPEVDAARVAEIRRELAEGRYAVDTGELAERMLRFERDLGN
ncbi:MAG: flagellar biosynthesis anti-sigma factor FlgM [Pseudomonadota bacterium]